MKLIWKSLALADRERIMDYIAEDKPQAAIDLDESFEHTADQFLLNPRMYKPGRVKKTREAVVHPNYIMVYAIEGDTISILRVLHSAQAWP
ncbi:addiction module antitoxin [Undibacterium sp. KW1]|uniref:type II toxin-antitoxin system RelE/ParE family toxin n=1 Tax=Undibacterium sp. KW1 TaxID=2058624 RepID=UPI001331E4CB|nr:type II toxin-antitoxin system RelE/ParE family toxin [Undibacterium sp. KW1]BBB62367.1 addiction module antitoxin [Undibacterium sp. KW1]